MAAVEVFKHEEHDEMGDESVNSLLVLIWLLLLSGVGTAEKIEGSMLKLDISQVRG
jgi:hypothetical protein